MDDLLLLGDDELLTDMLDDHELVVEHEVVLDEIDEIYLYSQIYSYDLELLRLYDEMGEMDEMDILYTVLEVVVVELDDVDES